MPVTDASAKKQNFAARWAEQLVDGYRQLPASEFAEQISGIRLMHSLGAKPVRTFVRTYGDEAGLHGLRQFVDLALREPHTVVETVTDEIGDGFTKKHRERLELAVQAYGLGIIRTYRMRSYFHVLIREFFYLGENELHLVAEILAHIVGADSAVRKLYRKLRTRDAELREYLLYLMAEFADVEIFDDYKQKLRHLYESERDRYVCEAYEYLFDFGQA